MIFLGTELAYQLRLSVLFQNFPEILPADGHQNLLQPLGRVKQDPVTDEVSNANKLARNRIQGWAVAWNTARYNQQQAGLPLTDLVRGDTLQESTLYLAASPRFPPADALRWRTTILAMHDDGSLARILKQYDYQAP